MRFIRSSEEGGGHPVRSIQFRRVVMAFCEVYPFENSGRRVFCEMYPFDIGGKVSCGLYPFQKGGASCGVYPFQNSGDGVL